MARLEARIPQRELATMLGISSAFLSSIEQARNGARLPPYLYEKLPTVIRNAVIDAAIVELRVEIDKLEAMR